MALKPFASCERGANFPILILSGSESQEEIDAAFEAGCNGYLTKPIDKEKLIDSCVQALCGGSQTRRNNRSNDQSQTGWGESIHVTPITSQFVEEADG